jgi:hypothetical protein
MDVNPAIEKLMSDARVAAMEPKPTIDEMIEVVMAEAADREGRQQRMLYTADRSQPYAPAMREVAILDALARFLVVVKENQTAVGAVLRRAKAGVG